MLFITRTPVASAVPPAAESVYVFIKESMSLDAVTAISFITRSTPVRASVAATVLKLIPSPMRRMTFLYLPSV